MFKTIHLDTLRPRLSAWFPWITSSDCDILDRNFARKLHYCTQCKHNSSCVLTMAEALTALKWYSNIPEGFRTEEDNAAAQLLQDKVNEALAV